MMPPTQRYRFQPTSERASDLPGCISYPLAELAELANPAFSATKGKNETD